MAQFQAQGAGSDNEAQAINEKAKMMQEYNRSFSGSAPTPTGTAVRPAPTREPGVPARFNSLKPSGGMHPPVKVIDTKEMLRPLGSFKKGGKVKKTGVYKLHAGEKVLNAKQTKAAEKPGSPLMSKLAGQKPQTKENC